MNNIIFKISRNDLYEKKGNVAVQISRKLSTYFFKNLLQNADRFWSLLAQRKVGGGLLCGN